MLPWSLDTQVASILSHSSRHGYWWPSMAWDVSQYVRGCSVCAISKTPHHLPARKLVPIPRRPWSYVGVNFITDLPKSEGYTCILVAVDRFFSNLINTNLNSTHTLFATVERLTNPPSQIPSKILSDSKCNEFASFFYEKINNIRKEIVIRKEIF